ncbi:MAG TPA: carboxypeptidase regulatory-like domain-containing protein [Pseudonocardiaceae bacterium]
MNTTGDSFGGQPRGEGWGGEDALLLAELGDLLDIADPVPDGLTARIGFAMDLEQLDVEVARWERLDQLSGVRGRTAPSTITFTIEDLTVMVSLAQAAHGHRFDGWLVPAGTHRIEVRVDGHQALTTAADEGGRFALPEVPPGLTQILVHMAVPGQDRPRTVITPTIML